MVTPKILRRVVCILLLMSQTAQLHLAQATKSPGAPVESYRAYDASGKQVTLSDIISAFSGADVALIGETHNDAIAHLLEADLLRGAHESHGLNAKGQARPVALSLEMFERDTQLVLDEYLAGQISEKHFLLSSRPWNNYATDYRPLVEYARERKLPVIAANAPARYVSRVSSLGPASLKELSKEAKAWLPPLPFHPASQAYAAKFNQLMGLAASSTPPPAQMPGAGGPHGALHLLDAQTLRDATMASAITEHLKHQPQALIVHVNGKFHSEERLGVPEQIKLDRPKTRLLVITIVRGEGFPAFDAGRLGRLGDYVILTDPSVPTSN